MFPSLGYVTELERVAERGTATVRSAVDVDERAVRRAARRAFPDAESVAVHGDPAAGDGGVTYAFTPDDREDRYVLKVAPEAAADHLERGAAVYRYLDAETDVPVPGVWTVRADGGDLGYPYTVVEHVAGDELTSVDQFESFPRERKTALVRGMGRALGTLHAETSFEACGAVAPGDDGGLAVADGTDWRSHYAATYERYASRAAETPVGDLADRASEAFERTASEVDPGTDPTLLHADFTPDNLITADGSVRAVLDWEHAEAGRPAREFWTVEENVVRIVESAATRRALRAALHEGYGAVRPISDRFRALVAAFAVGEATRVGGVYSLLVDLDDGFDADEFRDRAERELDARIEAAEVALGRIS